MRKTEVARPALILGVVGVVMLLAVAARSVPANVAPTTMAQAYGLDPVDGTVATLQERKFDGFDASLVAYRSENGQCLDVLVSASADRAVLGAVGGCGFPVESRLSEGWVVGTLALDNQTLAIALGPAPVGADEVVVGLVSGENLTAPVSGGAWFAVATAPSGIQTAFEMFDSLAANQDGQLNAQVELRAEFRIEPTVFEEHNH